MSLHLPSYICIVIVGQFAKQQNINISDIIDRTAQ